MGTESKYLLGMALGVCLALPTAASAQDACAEASGERTVLRAARDTRIMQTHRSSNDGAAGLVWLKRSPHVRGLVGFDLSSIDPETVGCAALELTIYDGQPGTKGSYFSAHRMNAEWIEGNQSFNRLRSNGQQLGSFPGTGQGTTWDCRVDTDPANSNNSNCPTEDRWLGGEDCNGSKCYETPATDDAFYADKDQEILSFDVTDDVAAATDEISWLLKVRDETSKSGSVKFYTKNGAAFLAVADPELSVEESLDLVPRLVLYGVGAPPPPPETCTVESPSGGNEPSSCGNSRLCYDVKTTKGTPAFQEQEAEAIGTALGTRLYDVKRIQSACVPAEVGAVPIVDPASHHLAYDVKRSAGEPKNDVWKGAVVHDLFGELLIDTQGADRLLTSAALELGGVATAPPAGVADPYLCHKMKTSSGTQFPSDLQLRVPDAFEDRLYDVKKPVRLCLPATLGGEAPANGNLYAMCYKAVRAAGEPKHAKRVGEIHAADLFGGLELDTRVEEEICVPAIVTPPS